MGGEHRAGEVDGARAESGPAHRAGPRRHRPTGFRSTRAGRAGRLTPPTHPAGGARAPLVTLATLVLAGLLLATWPLAPVVAAERCPAEHGWLGRTPETFELELVENAEPDVKHRFSMDFTSHDGCHTNRWMMSDGHLIVERTDGTAILGPAPDPVVIPGDQAPPERWVGYLDDALWQLGPGVPVNGSETLDLPDEVEDLVPSLPPETARPSAAPGWTVAAGDLLGLLHDGSADGVGATRWVLVRSNPNGTEQEVTELGGSLNLSRGGVHEIDRLWLLGGDDEDVMFATLRQGEDEDAAEHWTWREARGATRIVTDQRYIRSDQPLVRVPDAGDDATKVTSSLTFLDNSVALIGVDPDAVVATSENVTVTWWDRIDRGTLAQIGFTVVGVGLILFLIMAGATVVVMRRKQADDAPPPDAS